MMMSLIFVDVNAIKENIQSLDPVDLFVRLFPPGTLVLQRCVL